MKGKMGDDLFKGERKQRDGKSEEKRKQRVERVKLGTLCDNG